MIRIELLNFALRKFIILIFYYFNIAAVEGIYAHSDILKMLIIIRYSSNMTRSMSNTKVMSLFYTFAFCFHAANVQLKEYIKNFNRIQVSNFIFLN